MVVVDDVLCVIYVLFCVVVLYLDLFVLLLLLMLLLFSMELNDYRLLCVVCDLLILVGGSGVLCVM